MGARAQHDPAYRRFYPLLRRWRLEAGLTQRELAEKLGKPRSFVHKCEVGDRRIDPVEWVRWCRACRRKPAEAVRQLERLVPVR
ncbi:MAG: helix-turn-helix transcriptional regulator [Phycisphaeraceae bacterium]